MTINMIMFGESSQALILSTLAELKENLCPAGTSILKTEKPKQETLDLIILMKCQRTTGTS